MAEWEVSCFDICVYICICEYVCIICVYMCINVRISDIFLISLWGGHLDAIEQYTNIVVYQLMAL